MVTARDHWDHPVLVSTPPTQIGIMQNNFLMHHSRLCRLHDGLGDIIANLSPHLSADNR